MNEMDLIKEIRTKSGNVYLYIVNENKIISVQKEWYDKLPKTGRKSIVLSALHNSGIHTTAPSVQFDFSYTPEILWDAIENNVESLILEVTQQCSLRCNYCIYSGNYREERTHNAKHMSRKMISQCIDYYYQHSLKAKNGNISFYGGESLLQFYDIQFAIDYAIQKWKDKPISFQISTNGTTLTKAVLDWLDNQQTVSLLITCNGPTQDLYRRFPDGTGSLSIVMQTINQIRNNYPSVWERTNFIANVTSRRELLNLRSFYMKEVGKAPIDITGIKREYGNNSIQNMFSQKDTDEDREYITELFCKNDPYIRHFGNINGICIRQVGVEAKIEQRTMFCKPLSHSLFISAEGDFRPCEELCSNINFGNIFNGYSKEKITAMLKSIHEVFKTRCQKCWGRRLCSICFANIHLDMYGQPILPEAYCEEQKKEMEKELLLFCEVGERNPELIQKIISDYQLKFGAGHTR